MLKLRRVAVTGGIASGKSTVTEVLQNLGAYVVSADQITHQLLSSNTELIKNVISLLGSEILVDGCIDRKRVAAKVFRTPELLSKLEALIHPKVASVIAQLWGEEQKKQKDLLFVAEVALLFEAGQEGFYDAIVAVVADEEECQKRFLEVTGNNAEEYTRRAGRQLTQAQKAKRANFVIENRGSKQELQNKAKELYKLLTQGD